jgi:hypothetical protein
MSASRSLLYFSFWKKRFVENRCENLDVWMIKVAFGHQNRQKAEPNTDFNQTLFFMEIKDKLHVRACKTPWSLDHENKVSCSYIATVSIYHIDNQTLFFYFQYIYIYIYIYVCVYIYMYICVYICIYMCIYMCILYII